MRRLALAGAVALAGWLATPWVVWWAREWRRARHNRLAGWYGRPAHRYPLIRNGGLRP